MLVALAISEVDNVGKIDHLQVSLHRISHSS
jgi:hypothetical protein